MPCAQRPAAPGKDARTGQPMKHRPAACKKERPDARPRYEVAETAEGGMQGWLIKIFDARRIFYRVVSGHEQVVERESDCLYLCVASKKHRNIGFKFRCVRPRVTHSVDRKTKTCTIKLLVVE